jgi:hypothetical protein
MTTQTNRRLSGLALGVLLGLAFGIPSQAINSLAVPQIPFYQPPFGMLPNIVGCALLGGLIGLVCAWPKSSFAGVLIAALGGSIFLELSGSLSGSQVPSEKIGGLIVSLTVLLLPLVGLLGAVLSLFRWTVNKQVEYHADHTALLRRLVAPVLLMCIVGGLSATVLYPPEGQQRVKDMHALIQAGLQAADATRVPPALANFADTFTQRATPDYTLQWITGNLIDWHIGQPAGYQEWQYSIVAARFDNGWIVACLFSPGDGPPNCKSYDRDPSVKYPSDPN